MKYILLLTLAFLTAVAAETGTAETKANESMSGMESILFDTDNEDKLFDEALRSHRTVFAVFLGVNTLSMKLEQEVLSKPEFQKYAKNNLLIYMVKRQVNGQHHTEERVKFDAVCRKYNVRGLPAVILISPKREILVRTGYRAGGPEKYIEHIKYMLNK